MRKGRHRIRQNVACMLAVLLTSVNFACSGGVIYATQENTSETENIEETQESEESEEACQEEEEILAETQESGETAEAEQEGEGEQTDGTEDEASESSEELMAQETAGDTGDSDKIEADPVTEETASGEEKTDGAEDSDAESGEADGAEDSDAESGEANGVEDSDTETGEGEEVLTDDTETAEEQESCTCNTLCTGEAVDEECVLCVQDISLCCVQEEEEEETGEEEWEASEEAVAAARDVDFSSQELLVKAADQSMMEDSDVTGAYGDVYMTEYSSQEETREAYLWYYDHAELVDANTRSFVLAEEDVSAEEETAASGNPLEELAAAAEETGEIWIDGDTLLIALVDSGVGETADVVGAVSMLGEDVTDEYGHGSEMLSYIFAENPEAQVLSVKVFGSSGTTDAASVYAGIKYAIEAGADIINLSFYAQDSDNNAIVKDAVEEALEADILVVGAAGNAGRDASGYITACIDGVLAIGAADENAVKTASSNYGDAIDYYVIAESTSEAAARFSGILSRELGGDVSAMDRWDPASCENVFLPEEISLEENVESEIGEEVETAAIPQADDYTPHSGSSTGANIYSVDPFPEEYADGYVMLYTNQIATVSWTDQLPEGCDDTATNGYITATSPGEQYIDVLNAGVYNNESFDVRIYLWTTGNTNISFIYAVPDGRIWVGGKPASNDAFMYTWMEWHFYESGHVGEDEYETSFKGVIRNGDLDYNEGIVLPEEAEVWVAEETFIVQEDSIGENAWIGTVYNNRATVNTTDTLYQVWHTEEGSPEDPLVYAIAIGNKNQIYASPMGYTGTGITYQIVETEDGGKAPDGGGAMIESYYVATYGYYTADVPAREVAGYTFDGWYSDETCTNAAVTEMISEETTYYGTYYPEYYTLTLSVEVNGDMADSNQEFTYVYQILDADGNAVTLSDAEGSPVTTITLKAGESVTLEGLTYGSVITLEEEDGGKGYLPYYSYTVEEDGSVVTQGEGEEYTAWIDAVTGNVTVLYTNTKSTAVPTGVRLNTWSIVLAAAALVGGGINLAGKRRRI